ncbi:MAG TPA: flagellar biosynthesis protein FlhA, partial [Fimbriimonadaceae bacterium]|nr:flagellar biosynthesis protein FlhA [Fimbriimonadaceae bacterium]
STASGLMVTRAGQDRSMGGEVAAQLFGQHKAIGVASGALACMALVPGFPATLFLGCSAVLFGLYRFAQKTPQAANLFESPKSESKKSDEAVKAAPTGPEAVMTFLNVDQLEIEIGYGLTKLADPRVGGDLTERITATRRQIALELGFVMPTVRIRDSVHLQNTEYAIKVRGEEVARSTASPNEFLAVSSGAVIHPVPGTPTKDPVFGLEALWVSADTREAADRAGYTVIEPSAVISTHLAEIVKAHAPELLSRQDVQTLIDNAKQINEAVVSELVPNVLQLGDVQKVLQHLLRERIPIRDMVTILETMADFGSRVKDPDQLGELVRAAIARTITRQYLDPENKLYCITLEPTLERRLNESVSLTNFGSALVLDPGLQSELLSKLQQEVDSAFGRGYQAVLICSTQLRLPLRRLLEKYLPSLSVLAYNEIASRAEVEFVGAVKAA